jgi:hypothetical protein
MSQWIPPCDRKGSDDKNPKIEAPGGRESQRLKRGLTVFATINESRSFFNHRFEEESLSS